MPRKVSKIERLENWVSKVCGMYERNKTENAIHTKTAMLGLIFFMFSVFTFPKIWSYIENSHVQLTPDHVFWLLVIVIILLFGLMYATLIIRSKQ